MRGGLNISDNEKDPITDPVLTRVSTTNAAECNSMCSNHFDRKYCSENELSKVFYDKETENCRCQHCPDNNVQDEDRSISYDTPFWDYTSNDDSSPDSPCEKQCRENYDGFELPKCDNKKNALIFTMPLQQMANESAHVHLVIKRSILHWSWSTFPIMATKMKPNVMPSVRLMLEWNHWSVAIIWRPFCTSQTTKVKNVPVNIVTSLMPLAGNEKCCANAFRALDENGNKDPLCLSPKLTRAAQLHSEYQKLQGESGHRGPVGLETVRDP